MLVPAHPLGTHRDLCGYRVITPRFDQGSFLLKHPKRALNRGTAQRYGTEARHRSPLSQGRVPISHGEAHDSR